MKHLLFIVLLFSAGLGFTQDKIKVKCKKGIVYVNEVAWAKYEDAAGKTFLSTMAGEEFASAKQLEYGTGRYFTNSGKEIMHTYSEIHFINSDMEAFEVDDHPWDVFGLMFKQKVLDNDKFVLENAKKFKERYAQNVSEKVFLTK